MDDIEGAFAKLSGLLWELKEKNSPQLSESDLDIIVETIRMVNDAHAYSCNFSQYYADGKLSPKES
tara:strand:- start:223 stop:420 length:198 start_codon:yes stop_codon:yes gene_type:complete